MKTIWTLVILALLFVSCKESNTSTTTEAEANIETKELAYQSFGDKISDKDAISQKEMASKFENLKNGDTIDVKVIAKVNEVCQNKGCWMKLDMGGEEAMVKFKDYGFFMPKDIAGEEVIVSGKAFVNEMSVDEQRHYAEDAGETQEEIMAITEPKRTLSFESNGVLLTKKD